ncbi:phytanoyl-CoA dioxygenase family protein [Planktomarina temperata]|nr:phytanoyl-CoA dioxygenase family protein [Planktomarina temperata]
MYSKYYEQIERDGYCVVNNAIDPPTVDQLRHKIEYLYQYGEKPSEEKIPRLNQKSRVVYNPDHKDVYFSKVVFSIQPLREILLHFLNDEWYKPIPQNSPNYILRAMIARSSSNTALPMHIDSFIPSSGKRSYIMQAALLLNDQTEENGCTLVVPGSHRSDDYAPPEAFESATPVIASKGDLVIWDSRLWHAALPNNTGEDRWSLISTFTRWWIKQNYHTPESLPSDIYNNLTNEERSILGFCSHPPKNEFERVDIKAGYEILNKQERENT